MQTLDKKQFEEMYGSFAAKQFDEGDKGNTFFKQIKEQLASGVGNFTGGYGELMAGPDVRGEDVVAAYRGGRQEDPLGNRRNIDPQGGALGASFEAGSQVLQGAVKGAASLGKMVGGAFQAVTAPLAPLFNLGAKAGEKLGQQVPDEVAMKGEDYLRAHPLIGENAQDALNLSSLTAPEAATALGSKVRPFTDRIANAPSKAGEMVKSLPTPDLSRANKYIKGAVRDVVPTSQSLIDQNLAVALDLTPGDLSKIELSTGNRVGSWMAENNLIGTNKETTQGLIQGFFQKNYEGVRSAIDKVEKTYKMAQVPRYADALLALQKKIEGVPGLEKQAVQIDNFLDPKRVVQLKDVQAVKELLDDHFSLYKVTGDVGEGVAKEGLANIRSELKSFIEDEVKQNIGEDISVMNRNVQTAKSLGDAIQVRDPRGLTRANFSTRDILMGLGLSYSFTPLTGIAFVFLKKLAFSPTARLRFARWLDTKSDTYKARLSEQIKNGEVPSDVRKVVPLEE